MQLAPKSSVFEPWVGHWLTEIYFYLSVLSQLPIRWLYANSQLAKNFILTSIILNYDDICIVNRCTEQLQSEYMSKTLHMPAVSSIASTARERTNASIPLTSSCPNAISWTGLVGFFSKDQTEFVVRNAALRHDGWTLAESYFSSASKNKPRGKRNVPKM
jgi:hypothetical protein